MADGGHIGAIAVLVELEASGGQIGAAALLVEFDENAGQIGAAASLVEFDESAGQVGAAALLAEFDESAGQVGAAALLTEFDESAGQIGSAAVLFEGEVPEVGMVGAAALLVEGESDPLGMVGAIAVLVEFNDDAGVFDLRSLNDRIGDLLAKISEWKDRYRALIDAGDATTGDFRSLQTQIVDCRKEIRAIRAILDPLRVRDALTFFDPVSLIKLWKWRAGMLRRLVELDSGLRGRSTTSRRSSPGPPLA